MQDRTGYFYYRRYSRVAGQQDPDAALGTGDHALRARRTLQIVVGRKSASHVKKKVLIIVENLPVPFDTRVWKEALSLHGGRVRSHRVVSPGQRIRQAGTRSDRTGSISTGIPCPKKGTALWVSVGIWLRAVLGVLLRLVDLSAARISCHSGLQSSGRHFSGRTAVQAVRGQVHLRSSRCESRSSTSRNTARRGCLYKVQVWLEKLTYRFSDVVMATNGSYRDLAVNRGGLAPRMCSSSATGPIWKPSKPFLRTLR